MEFSVKTISVEEVKKALDAGKHVLLLDVRTTEEYERGHIQGSVHIPIDSISGNMESILPNTEQTVYVYCLSGSRSMIAVRYMIQCGYKDVYSVMNGLLAWRAKGYPEVALETKKQ